MNSPHNPWMTIGPTSYTDIAERLRDVDISQRELAAALGWDTSALSRSLAGQRALRPEELDGILALLQAAGVGLPERAVDLGEAAPRLFYAMALRREMRSRSLRPADVTKLTGVPEKTVIDIVKHRGFDGRAARTIAAELSLEFQAMCAPMRLRGQGGEPAPGAAAHEHALRRAKGTAGREIPIYAPPRVSQQRVMQWDGRVAEYRPPPPPLASVEGAFGFFAPAGLLEPRYFGGEVLFVHPLRPPAPGSHVLVHMANDTVEIIQLLAMTPDRLLIGHSDRRDREFERSIPLAAVSKLQRIVGTWSE